MMDFFLGHCTEGSVDWRKGTDTGDLFNVGNGPERTIPGVAISTSGEYLDQVSRWLPRELTTLHFARR